MRAAAEVVRSGLAGLEVAVPVGWGAPVDVGVVGVELVRRDGEGVARASVRVTSEAVPAGMALATYEPPWV